MDSIDYYKDKINEFVTYQIGIWAKGHLREKQQDAALVFSQVGWLQRLAAQSLHAQMVDTWSVLWCSWTQSTNMPNLKIKVFSERAEAVLGVCHCSTDYILLHDPNYILYLHLLFLIIWWNISIHKANCSYSGFEDSVGSLPPSTCADYFLALLPKLLLFLLNLKAFQPKVRS